MTFWNLLFILLTGAGQGNKDKNRPFERYDIIESAVNCRQAIATEVPAHPLRN